MTFDSSLITVINKDSSKRVLALRFDSLKAGFHMIADRRSQIADRNKVCDRLRSYGNQPLDRTWFYLLRSSAIAIAGSQTIAEVVSI